MFSFLSVIMDGGRKFLTMGANVVSLDNATKAVLGVDVKEEARVELSKDVVYLRIDGDFNLNKDLATFFYRFDNKKWISIDSGYKMIFDYRKLFMGSKFAIFNYATKETGGNVDVDFFKYEI
jgi:beta-xylosidase